MIRITSAVFLCVPLLLAGGCKTVSLTITNYTDKVAKVQIDGPHVGPDKIGTVPGGEGKLHYDLNVPAGKLPATFDLEIGKHETTFTVNDSTPDKLWVDLTAEGIVGPRETPEPAKPSKAPQSRPGG